MAKRGILQTKKQTAINYRRKKEYDPGYFTFNEVYQLGVKDWTVAGRPVLFAFEQIFLFTSVTKAMEYAQAYVDKAIPRDEWELDGSIPLIFTKIDKYSIGSYTYHCVVEGRFEIEICQAFLDASNPVRQDVPLSDYPKLDSTWSQYLDEDE